jgi:hypothetical protein
LKCSSGAKEVVGLALSHKNELPELFPLDETVSELSRGQRKIIARAVDIFSSTANHLTGIESCKKQICVYWQD